VAVATFIFSYRAPKGYVATASEDTMAAWQAWLGGMGEALVDYGKPVFERSAVGTSGSGETELGGYSVVQASDLESALAIAKGCPLVGHGGCVEVGELADLQVSDSAF
jgi:YCII-related domain